MPAGRCLKRNLALSSSLRMGSVRATPRSYTAGDGLQIQPNFNCVNVCHDNHR